MGLLDEIGSGLGAAVPELFPLNLALGGAGPVDAGGGGKGKTLRLNLPGRAHFTHTDRPRIAENFAPWIAE
jgi:hypothetical protein